MKTTVATLGVLSVAASLSFGQGQPNKPPDGPHNRPSSEDIFKRLDTNGDGFLSLDEFKAGPMAKRDPARAEAIYKKMDVNSDGKVTLNEFKAYRPHRGNRSGNPSAPAPTGIPVK